MNNDESNRGSLEDIDDNLDRALDNAFGWLKGDQGHKRRATRKAFSITQMLDLPETQRELMLEINKSEPITLAELARKLERNPVELEIQVKQLVVQNWLEVTENEFGEWVYRVKLLRRSNRILPPGIWQVLDNQWQVAFFRLFSDAALEDFTVYDEKLPGNPNTTFLKGFSLEGMGQKQAAAEHYYQYLSVVQQGEQARYAYQRLVEWGYLKR